MTQRGPRPQPPSAAQEPAGARPFSFFRAGNRVDAAGREKPILVLEDVYKYFDRDRPVLRGANLTIERGEFVFVTGPSGAGKSTVLQLIYRKLTVDDGRILFCGRDIARLTGDSVPFLRRNLGIVFQDFKVVPHWTVAENVAVPLEILSMPQKVVRARIAEALERVGLAGRGNDRTGTLSGGEQQRVAVARAIVTEPALVLADEPTGNLDPQLALDILTLFEEINASGITVVFATHDHSLLEARPHRLVVIDEGRVFAARSGGEVWAGSHAAARTSAAGDPHPGAEHGLAARESLDASDLVSLQHVPG
jgi:cell division transport system ATP-binding protein